MDRHEPKTCLVLQAFDSLSLIEPFDTAVCMMMTDVHI
jgi:hypothetical protein